MLVLITLLSLTLNQMFSELPPNFSKDNVQIDVTNLETFRQIFIIFPQSHKGLLRFYAETSGDCRG